MSDKKMAVVLGGGTMNHVRAHMSIACPAFGTTARKIAKELELSEHTKHLDVKLVLTKMADNTSNLVTNDDVSKYVDELIVNPSMKIVFFNIAMADFNGQIDGDSSDKYAERLKSNKDYIMNLTPAAKVISKIRKSRKDITLVGFKATSGKSEDEQYIEGLGLLKKNSCNLVLANDIKTHVNVIITPEEARYHVTTNRDEAIKNLVEMAGMRSHLTFTRSTVVHGEPVSWHDAVIPATLRDVVDHCVAQGAYKPFLGATVGHFACKVNETTFLTSMRKTNFNDIAKNGLVKICTDGPDSVIAYGAKPSVGGQSQRIVFSEHEGMDCIVHFHCPIRPDSTVPRVSQREYECGSHECGQNTSNGLAEFVVDGHVIKAVFLTEHGPNIVFNGTTPSSIIKKFIDDNFDLSGKTGGYVSR